YTLYSIFRDTILEPVRHVAGGDLRGFNAVIRHDPRRPSLLYLKADSVDLGEELVAMLDMSASTPANASRDSVLWASALLTPLYLAVDSGTVFDISFSA